MNISLVFIFLLDLFNNKNLYTLKLSTNIKLNKSNDLIKTLAVYNGNVYGNFVRDVIVPKILNLIVNFNHINICFKIMKTLKDLFF